MAKSYKKPKKTQPKDLKKIGVQETGLAMQAAKKIAEQKKKRQKLLKEL